MIYRSKRYIALLLTSFALCAYFPEREHYELDNGIDIVLSPAMGGVIIGYEIGKILKKESIF